MLGNGCALTSSGRRRKTNEVETMKAAKRTVRTLLLTRKQVIVTARGDAMAAVPGSFIRWQQRKDPAVQWR